MKALVLAAGRGERLRPLTDGTPKPMIEIAGKPILQRNLEALAAAGVVAVRINLHYCPEAITSRFQGGHALGLDITYSYEPELRGTAGAAAEATGYLQGDDFLVVYGDNLSTIDLKGLIATHQAHDSDFTLALFKRADVCESGIVALSNDDRITRFLEKPDASEVFSNWVNAGYYVVKPWVLDIIPHDHPTDFGRDILPLLLARGARLYGYRMTEELWWIDTLADYERTAMQFEAKGYV